MNHGYYSDDLIEKIRYSNDLVEIANEYTKLKSKGSSYMGLCPFHQEKTPSFNVNPDRQLYYCFGCGVGGNIFNFVMEVEGLSFVEAVEYLADKANIDLPDQETSVQNRKKRNQRQQLLEIHKLATRFYQYLLLESDIGEVGYKYLKERGFTEEIMEKFKLGFAPDRWEQLYKFLQKKGYSDEILAKSGLVIPRKNSAGYYDRFRNRILFTICNHRGQPIGFGGRVLSPDDEPKYLNSPQTTVFDKSYNLYGLDQAKQSIRQQEEAIVMEGYTDVITAYQHGIKNVVASLGTSLTQGQAELLHRYAEKVYIAYDADIAGAEATVRGLDVLKKEGLAVEVIQLPVDQDPDDFIKAEGASSWQELIKQAVPLVQFKIDNVLEANTLQDVDDKLAIVEELLPILANIEADIERDEYSKLVAAELNIDLGVLKKEVNHYRNYRVQSNQDRKKQTRYNINNDLAEELDDKQVSGYDSAVEGLIKIVINHPEFITKLQQELSPNDFNNNKYQQIISHIYNYAAESDRFVVADLVEQVEAEELKNLLLKLSVEGVVNGDLNKMFADHISKVKEYQLRMKIASLDSEIKQAEAENNVSKLNQLLQEYQKYQRLLRKEGN
ncbi:DNA primase [Halanaerobaculum tunisiense]